MHIKIVDVDIHHLEVIQGLVDYDAVEILFRVGRIPIGRARIPCEGGFLDSKELMPIINDLPLPAPLDVPYEKLQTVTVAICTRNRPKDLAVALRSIKHLKYPPDEIIIIDNGCQNEVRDLVNSILPDAIYLAERRLGLNFARNRALLAAKGDIIAFLDDDIKADPYWVLSIAECFAKYPEAGAVTGLIITDEIETPAQEMFEANGGFGRGFSRRVLPQDGKRLFGLKVPNVAEAIGVGSGCNMAFKTSVLKQLHGFDGALDTGAPLPGGGDLDIFYRVMRAGFKLVYEPRVLVRHIHRRSREELLKQLTGHHRSLSAFLIKTITTEHGLALKSVILFLVWRLTKTWYRLIRSFTGHDPLPFTFLVRILIANFIGLGSYHASKLRISGFVRKYGGRPLGFTAQILEFWRYHELTWNLTIRNLKVKYQRSWLGFIWTLINPLITVLVLVTVFSIIVRLPIFHYWAFLISGFFVWNFFSQTLVGGVQTAVDSAYLTRSAYFPQEVIIISSALARFIEFVVELAIVLLLLIIFHHKGVPFSFLMVLPLIPILFLFAIGLLFPLVTLAIYFHDVIQVTPLAIMLFFYISPVFYNIDLVPESIQAFYFFNPMALMLDLFHTVLYLGEMPNLRNLLLMLIEAITFVSLGYLVFNRKKREFAEII